MKDYQKPEFELITLIAQEKITTDEEDNSGSGVLPGIPGLESAGDLFG